MKSIAVYCGSSNGNSPVFISAAQHLGLQMAKQNISLVYGGAQIGIMGAIADELLKHSAPVIGVIPKFLSSKEIAHPGVSQMIVVDTMHERKTKMYELSDGFIALPGGFGTLEELFEMTTWAQLGLHQKPIGILNVDGYYDHLIAHIDTMVNNGFMKRETGDLILVDSDPNSLLSKMKNYVSKVDVNWISDIDQT